MSFKKALDRQKPDDRPAADGLARADRAEGLGHKAAVGPAETPPNEDRELTGM